MTATARLFTLGKAQAVRIPARFRLQADEVEITEHDGALILRPKARTAGEFFARLRAKHGPADFRFPDDLPPEPVEPLEP